MMGQHDRSEALFYYFRLEDQIPETHLLRLIDKHISFVFVREKLKESYSVLTSLRCLFSFLQDDECYRDVSPSKGAADARMAVYGELSVPVGRTIRCRFACSPKEAQIPWYSSSGFQWESW